MPMLIYNQSRSFQTYVNESSGADAQRLGQLVRQRGVLGQKGCVRCAALYFAVLSWAVLGWAVLSWAVLCCALLAFGPGAGR